MGSSTGNMLVDRREALEKIFASSTLPIMTHCEDTDIINRNMAAAIEKYGDDPKVIHHPEIRSEEACYESTRLAVELARQHQARLHVAHLTTARELELISPDDPAITAEATVSHLYFYDRDYTALGTRIKCNPAIKTLRDRDALREALNDGRIAVIGTDHAPHLLSQKEGGCQKAASGMPMIQFSLVTMLELVDQGVLSIERLVELMCHNPARLFEVRQRGFLREGYQADIVLVRPDTGWTVTKDVIQSKCGWSPMEGHNWPYFFFAWQVKDPSEKERLRQEAEVFLDTLEGNYHAHVLFLLLDAYSDGDDIIVSDNKRIPMLRQQEVGSGYRSLADYVAPLESDGSSLTSKIGLFATSADMGMETDFASDAYQKMMAQLLADRLAEAAAEVLHEQVRKHLWGYAPDENLSIADMLIEMFQGIRPAVGYPSLPDTSLNFVLDDLLDMKQIGIRLTESGAMKPHASVSGLMLAHPEARYFNLGKIGEDQLRNYARRRGLPIEICRKFLAGNL